MQAVSKEMFTGATGRDTVKQTLAQVEQSPLGPEEKKRLLDLLHSVDNLNASAGGAASGVMAGGMNVPYQVRGEAVTSSQGVKYNAYGHAFAGMCVQFILFIGVDVGVGLLLQRQRGLWKRLRAAPLSRGMLLGSRISSAAIIAFVDLQVIFTFARLVFGVHVEGSLAGFLGVCAAFSLMTAAYGLLIAAIGKTPEATRGLSILTTLLLVMLGGAWIPSFMFPVWLQKVTLAMPTRWAVDGLDAMTWRGLGFAAAAGPIAVLLGFALVFGGLAMLQFRWEEN
jgi:ABC-2 type transport system permease protein